MMRTLLDDSLYRYSPDENWDATPIPPLFVLTRFNIAISGAREKGQVEEEDAFRAWCTSRSGIFRKVCLPSVTSQTLKPRGWLILFDVRYIAETREALDAISHFDWIFPIFVQEGDVVSTYRQFYNPVIRSLLSEHDTFVVTTRLDNDDSVCRTFVDSASRYAASAIKNCIEVPFWISFPYGVQWDGKEVLLMIMNNNPFLSLVEPASMARRDRLRTAMSVNHGQVFNHGRVLTPSTRFPMWLQYTHHENVSNRKNLSLKAFRDADKLLSFFALSPSD